MKNYNKIALACCSAAFGLFTLAGCEGGEIFEVDAPDWISDKVQEIEDGNKQEEEVLEGMMEDVYTFGNTDFSSGWWTAFSKYYVIPDGQKWNAVFNLNINPSAPNTYKNFALIICADANRDSEGYKEYGAIRFDNQPSGNSEWGDYIDRSYIQSTLTFETDTDAGIDKLGGKVTLTVDRTNPEAFNITMTNGVVTKTYKQPSALENLNSDASNTNIRCFIVPEGSYIDFLQTNIEPIGGCTSAADKNPVSMILQNVPLEVNAGTEISEAMAGVTAEVTFEEGVTKTVTASELSFSAIPDMDTAGEKTLVAAYNKTFKGENCDKPIMANAKFEVVESIKSIAVTTQPSHTTYYYYTTKATEALTDRTMAFDPTGMVVTATESTGKQRVLDNSRLTFSAIPATAGTHKVTITAGEGITAEVSITVQESQVSPVSYTGTVGATDNSTGFLQAYTDNFKVAVGETKSVSFTNYSNLSGNWNNFIVALRKNDNSLYYWLRADNYGRNAADVEIPFPHSGTQWVNQTWEEWLQSMNGAEVTVYVTNCGNGTADVQIEMIGNDNQLDIQYYLGANAIDPDDLNFALSVDGCHLVFE
ncbi:MAG: bacterial Ig-like domain-containing protein [Candidatus Phocaeicola faecipullorum]|nr:bacterial Ig-like domain-containing protein [Candidatus Phocaeicola faecipullorum]